MEEGETLTLTARPRQSSQQGGRSVRQCLSLFTHRPMSLILSDLEPVTALQLRGKLHPPARRLCSRSLEGCSPPGASLILGSVAVCADFIA